eukprot:Selendium_serpulae@DN4464_c0_g1_i2.p1
MGDFAAGRVNLLITTVVAEEGMDVPAANCVLRFDPVLNAVSFPQGRGRARQADSSFVVLAERADRRVAELVAAEQRQRAVVQSFAAGTGLGFGSEADREAAERRKQQSREQGALSVLNGAMPPLATLNLYAKKTKAQLQEDYLPDGECVLTYTSCLRTCKAGGRGVLKKAAKAAAAQALLVELQA